MAEIILQDIRIGTDVHMLVTLTDSGVAISWDSVDIQQLFAYSEPQRAFAGNCTYVIDEEDATKLHVTYPAAVQKLLGKMRLVAQVNLLGNVATYDAFAFNIVKFSDDDEDSTVEEIEVPLAVEAVDTTIMYEILRACQAATAAANEAKEGADEAADAATAAAAAANSAAEAANSAAEAATAAKEAADLATAAANAAADSANSAAADATAGAAAANSAAAAATAAKEAADRATTAANSAAAAATSAANSANAAASAATTATTNANAATAAANSAATAANSAAAAATAAKEAADLATVAATAAAAAANAAAARVETAIENAAAATTAANSAAAAANTAAEAASSAAAAATAAKEAADLATTAANTAAATANTAAEAANSAAAAAEAAAAQIPALIANKANIDGWYSAMTVGAAENLVGRGTTPAVISFRPAGGTQDIGSGAATIAKIKGRTDRWNQLAKMTGTGSVGGVAITYTSNRLVAKGTPSVQLTGETLINDANWDSIQTTPGHKYFIILVGKCVGCTIENNGRTINWLDGGISAPASVYSPVALLHIYQTSLQEIDIDLEFIYVDLTLQYGAGREPATVAAFLAEYPEVLFAPYNAGKLVSNKMTALVTDGFNQFNEVPINGLIDGDGETILSLSGFQHSEYLPAFPNMAYYLNYNVSGRYSVFCYDANKKYLSRHGGAQVFTTPANTAFIRINFLAANLGNVNLNLSHSGTRNGEYEPYWESEHALNIPTMMGKKIVNGSTEGQESVNIFADMVGDTPVVGMKGIDSVYDFGQVEVDGYIRKVTKKIATFGVTSDLSLDSIVLTSLASSNAVFIGLPLEGKIRGRNLSNKYNEDTTATQSSTQADKTIRLTENSACCIRDTSILASGMTKEQVRTALLGVTFIYELETPEEYLLDTPIASNYRVDDFGTERRLPDGIVDGAPASTPLVADIQYAMNAVDPLRNLPRNYLSKQSTENLLAAMQSAGIIAGYTMTYDEDNAEYDFTITAPAGA